MRRWLVAGGVIEGPGGLLLVRNHRHSGHRDWSPPGGVVDDGEAVLEGLTREVAEETGLRVSSWHGPVYEITADAPGLGWQLRVEAHRATAWAGELAPADPDGIVSTAAFCDPAGIRSCLSGAPRWVAEPVLDWLSAPWAGSRGYTYRIEGTDLASLEVHRC